MGTARSFFFVGPRSPALMVSRSQVPCVGIPATFWRLVLILDFSCYNPNQNPSFNPSPDPNPNRHLNPNPNQKPSPYSLP